MIADCDSSLIVQSLIIIVSALLENIYQIFINSYSNVIVNVTQLKVSNNLVGGQWQIFNIMYYVYE